MLIGHQKIISELKADADAGLLHHAQIFLGPEHVGKSKVALLLAMHMQCPDESQVILRKHIAEGADPDTIFFHDDGEVLEIEKIRGLIARSSVSHTGRNLIFVIENIGRMKDAAMNALLKTLEEPREGVFFFMTANREQNILETIRSRSRIVKFSTVPDAEILAAFPGDVYAPELALFAIGRPGVFMRLREDKDEFEKYRQMYADVNVFLENPTLPGVFEMVRKYEGKNELLDLLLMRSRFYLLREHAGAHSSASAIPPALVHLDFSKVCEDVENAKNDIMANVNAKLVLENLLIPFVA